MKIYVLYIHLVYLYPRVLHRCLMGFVLILFYRILTINYLLKRLIMKFFFNELQILLIFDLVLSLVRCVLNLFSTGALDTF